MVKVTIQSHETKEEVELYLLEEIKEDIKLKRIKSGEILNAINRNFLETNYGFENTEVKKLIDDKVICIGSNNIYTFENILNLKVNDIIAIHSEHDQVIKLDADISEELISKYVKDINYKYRYVMGEVFEDFLNNNKLPIIIDKNFIDIFMSVVKKKVKVDIKEDIAEQKRLKRQEKINKSKSIDNEYEKTGIYANSNIEIKDKTIIDTLSKSHDYKIVLKNIKVCEVLDYDFVSRYSCNFSSIFKYLISSTVADFIYYKDNKKELDINLKPYMITINGTRVNRDNLEYICEMLLAGNITADSNLIYYLNKLSKSKSDLLFIEKISTRVSGENIKIDVEVKPIDSNTVTVKIIDSKKNFTFNDLKFLIDNYKSYNYWTERATIKNINVDTNRILKLMRGLGIDKSTFLEYARKKVMLSKLSTGDEDEDK